MQNTNGKRTTNKQQTNGRRTADQRHATDKKQRWWGSTCANLCRTSSNNKPTTSQQQTNGRRTANNQPRPALYIHHRNWMQRQWQTLRLSSVSTATNVSLSIINSGGEAQKCEVMQNTNDKQETNKRQTNDKRTTNKRQTNNQEPPYISIIETGCNASGKRWGFPVCHRQECFSIHHKQQWWGSKDARWCRTQTTNKRQTNDKRTTNKRQANNKRPTNE